MNKTIVYSIAMGFAISTAATFAADEVAAPVTTVSADEIESMPSNADLLKRLEALDGPEDDHVLALVEPEEPHEGEPTVGRAQPFQPLGVPCVDAGDVVGGLRRGSGHGGWLGHRRGRGARGDEEGEQQSHAPLYHRAQPERRIR